MKTSNLLGIAGILWKGRKMSFALIGLQLAYTYYKSRKDKKQKLKKEAV